MKEHDSLSLHRASFNDRRAPPIDPIDTLLSA
jgi:hypothetical protein